MTKEGGRHEVSLFGHVVQPALSVGCVTVGLAVVVVVVVPVPATGAVAVVVVVVGRVKGVVSPFSEATEAVGAAERLVQLRAASQL